MNKTATRKPSTKKPAAKKSAKAKPAKPKFKAKVRKAPEVYVCIVDGWVKYHGRQYEKGETILIHLDRMTDSDLATLEKYFELKPTEVMAGVSEPVEQLDEGVNHGSNSS